MRLLLDSRDVDMSMASNPTFVFLSSLKPLFFNSPGNEFTSRTTWEHKTPESNKSVSGYAESCMTLSYCVVTQPWGLDKANRRTR